LQPDTIVHAGKADLRPPPRSASVRATARARAARRSARRSGRGLQPRRRPDCVSAASTATHGVPDRWGRDRRCRRTRRVRRRSSFASQPTPVGRRRVRASQVLPRPLRLDARGQDEERRCLDVLPAERPAVTGRAVRHMATATAMESRTSRSLVAARLRPGRTRRRERSIRLARSTGWSACSDR
jgi:hypothetical protein